MNRLVAAFDSLRRDGRRALVPFITGGYPDSQTTVDLLRRVDPCRCACVEIGIPYSDPIADGPVIQTSFSRALESGFCVESLLEAVRSARDQIAVPLAMMVSYSLVYRQGPARFVETIQEAGFDGLIVPDLAIEEAGELAALGRQHGCPLVMIVAPTSDAGRREQIAGLSEPFIYYQAIAGVTGERTSLPAELARQVQQLRQASGKPICVGFGISTPAQVREVCYVADGAIVGSAIVRRMNAAVDQSLPRAEVVGQVCRFIEELAAAVPEEGMGD